MSHGHVLDDELVDVGGVFAKGTLHGTLGQVLLPDLDLEVGADVPSEVLLGETALAHEAGLRHHRRGWQDAARVVVGGGSCGGARALPLPVRRRCPRRRGDPGVLLVVRLKVAVPRWLLALSAAVRHDSHLGDVFFGGIGRRRSRRRQPRPVRELGSGGGTRRGGAVVGGERDVVRRLGPLWLGARKTAAEGDALPLGRLAQVGLPGHPGHRLPLPLGDLVRHGVRDSVLLIHVVVIMPNVAVVVVLAAGLAAVILWPEKTRGRHRRGG